MLSAVVAQTPAGESGGFDVFGLLLPLALAFLIFTMFRRQRKAQKQVKEMRTQLEPGSEVMTQFGLFGTIVSIDQENNRAVLELSPGNHATVHTQALSKVVQQDPVLQDDAVTDAERRDLDSYDGSAVPDDASSLDGVDGDRSAGGATAAGEARTGHETPEQTLERLDREQSNRDERDTRGPGGTTGTSDH
ncbi:preprotein translocase subunit YajC [Arthrobacter echini]|nr:preprotein translocase subunit YajC [Arthrobacter echini]